MWLLSRDYVRTSYEEQSNIKRHGPTLRSHSQVQWEVKPEWALSDDKEEEGVFGENDDTGYEPLPFIQLKGRKS
jgi:hypothetical protein